MTAVLLSIGLVVLLFIMLSAGVWVGIALFVIGIRALEAFSSAPIGAVLATTVWGASNSWSLAALPLFIWMGEILSRSGLSKSLFSGLAPWLRRVPGTLLHVNVLGCGILAAVTGSSAATAATVGKMSIKELLSRGYNEKLILGSLAGSGTLGLLIPPSIVLIVYGVATEQSIARLFLGGVFPGLMLLVMFSTYVAIASLISGDKSVTQLPSTTWREKMTASRELLPIALLIIGVLGSIYAGLASPTDAAAIGVVLAHVLSWQQNHLSKTTFTEAVHGAIKTSCMIAFILAGAAFLTIAMGFAGLPRMLAEWVGTLGLGTYGLLFALTILFIVLGCFLDGISVIVLTSAVIVPMVDQAGISLIWFGIFLVVLVEMAQITPPVGFNLFVIQGLTGRDIIYIAKAAFPFFLILMLGALLITIFPEIVLYLPNQM